MENCNIQNKDIVAMSILASHAYDDEIVFIPKGDIIIFVASHQSSCSNQGPQASKILESAGSTATILS